MLRLKYFEAAGPSQNDGLVDQLRADDQSVLQTFPRAQAGYASPEAALSQAVGAWLAGRGQRAEPVIVMVHGYMFDPTDSPDTSPDSPFDSIYGSPPRVDYHTSWLPLVGECDRSGGAAGENAIAFCYKSTAGLEEVRDSGWINSYQHAVFDLAPRAARALASILGAVADRAPLVRILAHSLGTRTTTQAMRLARARLPETLDRIVMLDGAEFCVDAAAAFTGCQQDVFNIVNRRDSVLRIGGDQACHPVRAVGTLGSCVIGYDGVGGNDRWLDLQLDNDSLVQWLAAGNAPDGKPYTINALAEEDSHPLAGLDHWACYTNDGNRALVRDLLLSDVMTVPRMLQHGVPGGTNAPAYGRFNNQPIPPTPQTRLDRQRMMAQAGAEGVGGGSG
jgi:hypothetical protein